MDQSCMKGCTNLHDTYMTNMKRIAGNVIVNLVMGTGSKLFILISWIGCVIQMGIVTEEFFRFDVYTKLEIYFPPSLIAPALTLCYPFIDIINLDEFNKKYGHAYKRPLGLKERMTMTDEIRMGDVFNMTTRFKPLIDSCIVRIPGEFGVLTGNATTCQTVFETNRFRMGEYFCTDFKLMNMPIDFLDKRYKMVSGEPAVVKARAKAKLNVTNATLPMPSKQIEWKFDMKTIVSALSSGATFYRFNVRVTSPGIEDTNLTRIVVHSVAGLPFTSFSLSPYLYRKYSMYRLFHNKDKNQVREINRFVISFSRIMTTKLPYPYASKCRANYSRSRCIRNCTRIKFVNAFNKHPFQTITEEGTVAGDVNLANMRLISQRDLKNVTFIKIFNRLEDECLTRCADPSCIMDYTMTRVSCAMGLDQSIASFTVATPDEPYISVVSSEKMPANDYFILIFSLIGFWVGLSAQDLSCLPCLIRYYEKKKNITLGNSIVHTHGEIKEQKKTWYCRRTRDLLMRAVDKETNRMVQNVVASFQVAGTQDFSLTA